MEKYVYTRDFTENASNCFKQALFETSWDSVKNLKEPNEPYNKFLEIFIELYEEYFLIRKIKTKPKRALSPSIINGIAKSSKRKQNLYEKFLKHRTPINEANYKAYKNLFETIKRKSKKRFYSEKLIKFQGDAKKTWCIMKELIGKVKIKKSSLPFKIVIDKTDILGEKNIANEFNNFFTDIGLKLAKKIPESSQPFESYMKKVNSEMENKPLSINELKDAFFSLKINKITGHHDISYNVVSKCFGELCTLLKHIIDLPFENGIFPDSIKIAEVTPVYTSGDSSSLSNYRPISELPCFSKMLESIMYRRLYSYLQEISDKQYKKKKQI